MKILRPQQATERSAITVVIPCYNYGRFLPSVVNSALDQERVDVRIIIVDDASTDDSAVIAQKLAASDSRIEVVLHVKNQGHIATYNDGLMRVDTPFFSLLSADDLLVPGCLGRATDLLATLPTVGMVYGKPIEFQDAAEPPTPLRTFFTSWTLWSGKEWINWAVSRGRCFILSPEAVVRTSAMEDVGYYNPALPHSGDLEYWLRIASRWDIARINGPVQAMYRIHGSNMHTISYSTIAADLSHRLAAFLFLAKPSAVPDLDFGSSSFERASKAIGREALILAQRELDSGGSHKTAVKLAEIARKADKNSQNTLRYHIFRWNLHRALNGDLPSRRQRVTETLRGQADRVRWRLWKLVGIS